MVGCQKSKCSSSWPPFTIFTCIVNIQTFIPWYSTHVWHTLYSVSRQRSFSSRSSLMQLRGQIGHAACHEERQESKQWTDLFTCGPDFMDRFCHSLFSDKLKARDKICTIEIINSQWLVIIAAIWVEQSDYIHQLMPFLKQFRCIRCWALKKNHRLDYCGRQQRKQCLLIKTTHAIVYMYNLLCVFISQYSNKVDFIWMDEAQRSSSKLHGDACRAVWQPGPFQWRR